MEIYNDSGKDYNRAMDRFLKQKSNDPVYVYRTHVARREMWVVLSTAELKANKISAKSAWMDVDGRHGLAGAKDRMQERMKEHPRLPLEVKAVRGLRQYYRAKEKLEKMERGADAPGRQAELDTTKA